MKHQHADDSDPDDPTSPMSEAELNALTPKAHRQEQQLFGEAPEHILQFFRYDHLPPALGDISRLFGDIAGVLVRELPRNPERTVALRKLLEAKDAAVRAKLAQ